jgi:hypothetical protein
MSHGLVKALRVRGGDVLTPLEAGMISSSDVEQLRHATAVGRVVYSFNVADFCRTHPDFLRRSEPHAGIIVADQQTLPIGEQMRRLLRLMKTLSADDMRNRLEYLGAWSAAK